MNFADRAQPGVLTDPTRHVEYLILNITKAPNSEELREAISNISNVEKSIGQKDTTAALSVTTGFSKNGWDQLFGDHNTPKELHDFPAMENGPRHFPSTKGDIFFMIKSSRIDLNFQVAKWLAFAFQDFTEISEDIQGYKYLDDRDMIDFVDGTENPKGDLRAKSVLVDDDLYYLGGSYLTFQKYVDRQPLWDKLTAEEQEGVIGRTKWDDLELPDDQKKPYAHNVKSKVKDDDGEELKMLRQNRAFGNAKEHGTIFVGFAKSPGVIETSLKQMITADEDGNYDKLLDFVDAKTGTNYFIPPAAFFETI